MLNKECRTPKFSYHFSGSKFPVRYSIFKTSDILGQALALKHQASFTPDTLVHTNSTPHTLGADQSPDPLGQDALLECHCKYTIF